MDILKSESEEEVNHLAMTFTTSRVHFDCLETVELVKGGSDKAVTLANKEEFVHSFCRWYLIGTRVHCPVIKINYMHACV